MNAEQDRLEPLKENGRVMRGRLAAAWLLVTAAVSGAVVMAVELLGARLLSVGYGASMAVWAAMIAVTLLSLAVGYFLGGIVSDRRPRPAVLYAVLLAAAVLVAVCPHLRFVLRAFYRVMGIEWGALISSLLLFFPPLVLFGVTSPFVIRLLSERGRGVGVTAGGVYAISTVGSVAGTLLTGLYLIPQFGTATGFRIAAAAIAVPAIVGLVSAAGWKGGAALVVPLAIALAPSGAPRVGMHYTAPDGAEVVVRAVRDSAHGRILVLDKGAYRLVVVNGILQTGLIAKTRPGEYLLSNYFQELLPYTGDHAAPRTALLVGLAGGLAAAMLGQYGIQVDAVELDPEMIAVAREWFGYDGNAVAADGRTFLEDCRNRYDFCLIDTYSGDAFPFYMASLEAFRAAKRVLKPGGVLAINFIGAPDGRPFASVWRTLREVFPHARAVKCNDTQDVQAMTLFASDRPIEFRGLGDVLGVERAAQVSDAVERLTVVPSRRDALLLTDAYNPVDVMRSAEAVGWRQQTAAALGEAVLFH